MAEGCARHLPTNGEREKMLSLNKGSKTTNSIWNEGPFLAGLIFTIIVLGIFAITLSLPVTTEDSVAISKWAYLKQATPNEIGDTIAGIAGSLAFVWLVVTVLLQAKELREQRIEFRKIASAQDEQVKLLRVQGDIFLEEQKQRKRENDRARVNSMISSLVTFTKQIDDDCRWALISLDKTDTSYYDKPFNTDGSIKMYSCTGHFKKWLPNLLEKSGKVRILEAPSYLVFQNMLVVIDELIYEAETLGSDLKIRIDNTRIHEMQFSLNQILSSNLWEDNVGEVLTE